MAPIPFMKIYYLDARIGYSLKARLHWRFLLRFRGDFTAISNRPCKLLIAAESPIVYTTQNSAWNRSNNRQCKRTITFQTREVRLEVQNSRGFCYWFAKHNGRAREKSPQFPAKSFDQIKFIILSLAIYWFAVYTKLSIHLRIHLGLLKAAGLQNRMDARASIHVLSRWTSCFCHWLFTGLV